MEKALAEEKARAALEKALAEETEGRHRQVAKLAAALDREQAQRLRAEGLRDQYWARWARLAGRPGAPGY